MGDFCVYNKSMNKTITITDQQHSLLCDLFSTIADLDLSEHCDDSSEFDSLWDAVIDAKDVLTPPNREVK
mgnify:CR=1 FL=1